MGIGSGFRSEGFRVARNVWVWSLSQVVLTGYTRQGMMLLVGGRPGRRVRELPLNACRARRTAKEHQQLVVVHAPCAHSKLFDDAQ